MSLLGNETLKDEIIRVSDLFLMGSSTFPSKHLRFVVCHTETKKK